MSQRTRERLTREVKLTALERTIDEAARTVEVAFSSETAVERWFGTEILDHDSQSVRLARLNGGAAVLVQHNPDDQVGVIENARIDEDKRGRAVLRFSNSKRGQEIFNDIKDGIRTLISVGYQVHEWNEKKDGNATIARAIDWEPYEVSIVSIPADASVGVGRSESEINQGRPMKKDGAQTGEAQSAPSTPKLDVAKERERTRKQELDRISAIRQMAEEHEFEELGAEHIENGTEARDFYRVLLEKVGERNATLRAAQEDATQEPMGSVGLSEAERGQFSIVRLMDALANPNDRASQKLAGFELEVCDEATRKLPGDYKVRGQFIPNEVLSGTRNLNSGTATDGAELVGTNLLAGSFIELLRNRLVTAKAGMMMLTGLVGNVDLPRQTSGAAVSWIAAEDNDAAEDEPQFGQISLSPKDAACYTEVTRRLMLQSTPAIEGLIRADLAQAMAEGIDLVVFYGTGAAGQPRGIANTTGVNSFNFAANDPTYAEITRMIKEVMLDNALIGTPQFMIDPEGWEALSVTPKQPGGNEGNFILGDSERIKGRPYAMTNQITAEDYFFGDFSQVILGEWGGLEINVDPYTHSLKGRTRFVMFKTIDLAIRQPGAFCYCNDGA